MALPENLEKLTAAHITDYNKTRGNTRESNSPFADNTSYMKILVEGSQRLVDKFRGSDEYKLDLKFREGTLG